MLDKMATETRQGLRVLVQVGCRPKSKLSTRYNNFDFIVP